MANYRNKKFSFSYLSGLILALALLLNSLVSFSQVLEANFLKPSIKQDAGNIIFNVVKIENKTNKDSRIKPVLILPEAWKSFSPNSIDTIVEANNSISLAYRIKIPQNASSEISHEISLQLFSESNQLLNSTSFFVQTIPVHNWEIIVPKERVYFRPGNDNAIFEIRIKNNGNTSETIILDIVPDKKIHLSGINENDLPEDINLKPGQDTIIKLLARYSYSEDRIFDLSRIEFSAYNENTRNKRIIILEKYSDNYSPFEIDNTLPHQAEIGVRTFSMNTEVLPFLKANGRATLGEKSKFDYNFNYYDLTQNENIIGNSYYHFLFTRDELSVGLGAFSSLLGRNLYNRNSIMASHKLRLSKTSTMEGFASYGFLDQKASVAFGYIYEKDKLLMNSSISLAVDPAQKINTASFIYRSNKITVAKGHDVSATIYAYNEEHYYSNKYSLTGVAWDINYYGRFSKKLTLQLTNNYGSPNIPGAQMGLLNFYAKVNLKTNLKGRYFTFKYVNTNKNYYFMNYEGFKLPNISLHDQYVNVIYHSFTGKTHRWSAGPSVEYYKSIKPLSNFDGDEIYTVRKFRVEYRSFIGTKLTLALKAGLGDIYYLADEEIEQQRYDLHILGDYNFGGYGIKWSYDYGPMVNTGIYQFAIDASNNSFNISPYAITQFFKGRVKLSFFANLTYRFDMKYGIVNINPKIETYVFKDWYFVVGGTYSYMNKEYRGSMIETSHYYTEFAIKKRWGKSDYKKWQKDLRRIKIIFFQDNNGNGIKDNYEQGIPNVKARLLLTNSADQELAANFPIDLTLLSNEKGNVIFNRIPMGFYNLTITPLIDQKEYFYVNKTAEKIEVIKTNIYYIPFQKASKIEGSIDVSYRKYSKLGEYPKDLVNIKVTAYSNDGSSYSAFSKKDGSFTLYAPGNNTYYIRISNVFGENFRILQNDIKVELPEPNFVAFKVVENNRQIKFKKVTPKQEGIPQAQKVKILPGKIYENKEQRLAEQNPLPEFNIKNKSVEEELILKNKFYVVLAEAIDRNNAIEYVKILRENGVYCRISIDRVKDKIIVFTNYYDKQDDAKDEIKKLKTSGIKKAEVYLTK